MITMNILYVMINQWDMEEPAFVATELCLVRLTSMMVITAAVCLHLQMDRNNVNILIQDIYYMLMQDVRMAR